MDVFSLPILAAVIIGIDILRDPRKMRIAVALLAGFMMTLVIGVGYALNLVSRLPWWGNSELDAWVLLALLALIFIGVLALAITLVINGITMIRLEGRSLSHLLSFLLGLAILLYTISGITAAFFEQLNIVGMLLVLALPLGWVGYGLIAFVIYSFVYIRTQRHFGGPVGAIIVLGAGVPNGQVRPLLASRIREGIRWQEREDQNGRRPLLLMSGGQGPDEPLPEAEAMANWAIANGADPTRILQEKLSTTTEENLRYSQALLNTLQPGLRVAVVTSGYHAFRAATLMREIGIPGYAIGAPTARYYVPSAMLREYIAILRDNLWLNVIAVTLLMSPFLFGILTLLNA